MSAETLLILARTNTRDQSIPFGIKQADRLSHLYVIGKTGVGKTTLLENLISRIFAPTEDAYSLTRTAILLIASPGACRARGMMTWSTVADPDQPYSYNPLTHGSFSTPAVCS